MSRDSIETLPARLRELREQAGLSQTDLATKAGTSPHSVAKLERGERSPSFRLACDLADALGVLTDDLRSPAGSPQVMRGKGRPKNKSEKVSD